MCTDKEKFFLDPSLRKSTINIIFTFFIALFIFPSIAEAQSYTKTIFTKGMTYLSSPTIIWDGSRGTYDDSQYDVPIGFTFNYYGKNYNIVRVSTNGYLTLYDISKSPGSTDGTEYSNGPIPSTTDPDNYLAPWGDDLEVCAQGTTDKVSYKTTSSTPNRVFTVEWKSVSYYEDESSSYMYFQVKLYETTNVIEFHYGANYSDSYYSPSATIGIENFDGTEGVGGPSSDGRTSSWPSVNYRFTPPSNRPPNTPIPYTPADDAWVDTLTPYFDWSDFNDPDAGDTQVAYQLKVWEDTGSNTDGTLLVLDKEYSGSASSATPAAGDYIGGGLVDGRDYHWHVRVKDNHGTWSDWSADTHTTHMDFTVMLGDSYEPDDTYVQAKTISSGVRQIHSIHKGGADINWVKFTLTAISDVTIETSGPSGNDTRMWLYDSSLSQIAFDDDGGTNLYSKITKSDLSEGTYYIKVDEYNNDKIIPTYYIDLTIIANTAPTLSWTGDLGYTSNGLEPESGTPSTNFVYRVKYTDADNDAPASGYPKVHIKKGGSEIAGSPFTMSAADSNPYSNGRKYTKTISGLSSGSDYTYYFEAKDNKNALATGSPVSSKSGPTVLAADIISYPLSSANVSDTVTIEVKVKNTGSATIENLWLGLDLYDSNDVRVEQTKTPKASWGGFDFGSAQNNSLSSGSIRTFSASYKFDTSSLGHVYSSGAYTWKMMAWEGMPGDTGSIKLTALETSPLTLSLKPEPDIEVYPESLVFEIER